MYYHMPPDHTWAPSTICGLLHADNLSSSVVGNAVEILWSFPEAPGFIERLLKRLLPQARRPKPPLRTTIQSYPEYFIRNVHVDGFEYAPVMCEIGRVLRECGYIEIGAEHSEREIANRYCPSDTVTRGLFDELESLEASIWEHLADQEFKKAVPLRDRANEIRSQIDAMLFASTSTT